MPVTPLDEHCWAIDTPASTYVIRVEVDPATGEAAPAQKYWGPRLTTDAARQVAAREARRHITSFSTPAEIEELLPVDGGTRWGAPSLQVSFGHARSVELRFAGASVHDEGGGAQRLDLALADAHHPFEVVLSVRAREDTDVIERWTTVRHRPDQVGEPVTVTRLDSASWFVPDQAGYRYSGVFGAWAEEFQLQRAPLPVGELVFTSRQGVTSHQANPWIMIDGGEAGEEHGEVWGIALAWSGSWRLIAQYKSVRRVIQHGAQFRLAGTPGQERSAVQYVLDDQVVALVYNPLGDAKRGPRWLRLVGLDPDALYEVVLGGDAGPGRLEHGSRWYGSALMAAGIRPAAWEPIGADYRSDMVVLKRVSR